MNRVNKLKRELFTSILMNTTYICVTSCSSVMFRINIWFQKKALLTPLSNDGQN